MYICLHHPLWEGLGEKSYISTYRVHTYIGKGVDDKVGR